MLDPKIRLILSKLYKKRGVDFRDYRPNYLKRRLDVRLRQNQVSSYEDYLTILNKNPKEYDRLISTITINVTEFFRNPEVFDVIKKEVVSEIVSMKKNRGQRFIRIWSAGSAYGEEAYTIAILFYDYLKNNINDFIIKIYGTDIDNECIERARLGIYDPSSIKSLSSSQINNYLSFTKDGYVVRDILRLLVKFKQHNLILDKPLLNMDLILCRNVAIYFTKKLQDILYINLYKALNRSGFLVLGKVESLYGKIQDFFYTINSRERIYRKKC
jgi:chemotaxis protein methyltransferase CheR